MRRPISLYFDAQLLHRPGTCLLRYISQCRGKTAIVLVCLVLSGCGGSSTAPGPAVATTVSLGGTVADQNGARLPGATVRIGDGINAGKSTTTNSNGEYRFDGLAADRGSVSATADGYDRVTAGIRIDGTKPLDFTLRTTEPWSKSGDGSAVFYMPAYITQVHIVGAYDGVSSAFIVHVGECAIVDDTIGTGGLRTRSDGIYSVIPAGNPPPRTEADGKVEIISSSGVAWSFTEARSSSGSGPCYLY